MLRFSTSVTLGAMRLTVGLLLSSVLLSAIPPSARADDAEESRFHDALAREHYEARRFEAALREFFEAARLAPSPRITFNIALCFELLNEDDDAYLFFREYLDALAAAGIEDDGERRAHATEAIRRLEGRVARVVVESDPPGAAIFVDQRDHGSYGTSPRVLALPPGAHRITLEREGHRPVTLEVEAVRGREATVTGTLERIVGTLHVASSAGGASASVRVPGAETVHTGPCPLDVALAPGLYEVELEAAGHRRYVQVVRVTADERVEVLAEPEALPPPTGDLTVTASAPGALVRLDGEPAGFAPTLFSGLSVGEHRVRLEHPGLTPYEGTVEVAAEARGWLTVTLEEPSYTDRSPATWVVGGVGLAAILAGALTLGLAVAQHDAFAQLEAELAAEPTSTTALLEARRQGEVLNVTTDVLMSIGGTSLAAAIVLYFATEHTDARDSRASYSEEARAEASSPVDVPAEETP